jgi:hypothetical protein
LYKNELIYLGYNGTVIRINLDDSAYPWTQTKVVLSEDLTYELDQYCYKCLLYEHYMIGFASATGSADDIAIWKYDLDGVNVTKVFTCTKNIFLDMVNGRVEAIIWKDNLIVQAFDCIVFYDLLAHEENVYPKIMYYGMNYERMSGLTVFGDEIWGCLWAGTNGRVCKFDPIQLEIEAFDLDCSLDLMDSSSCCFQSHRNQLVVHGRPRDDDMMNCTKRSNLYRIEVPLNSERELPNLLTKILKDAVCVDVYFSDE